MLDWLSCDHGAGWSNEVRIPFNMLRGGNRDHRSDGSEVNKRQNKP